MKKIFRILLIAGGLILGLFICLSVYINQSLFVPSRTDQELINSVFDPEFPGYSKVAILSSQGEGLRKIPRTIQVEVQIESYPQALTCKGQVFWAAGDPMVLGVTWETLACAGQNRYMELAQIALDRGLERTGCHAERIAYLLARWVNSGLISLDDIYFPVINEWVSGLIEDPNFLNQLEPWDGGLFDTADIVVREDILRENGPDNRSSFVLRCNGTLEQYLIDPGYIHAYTNIPVGDDLMPNTLIPFK